MRSRGFSLIELLVAMAVLAVLASVSFRGLNSVLDAEAGVAAETRRWNEIALVATQFGRDLSLAVERSRRDHADGMRPALGLRRGLGPATEDAGSQLAFTRLGDGDSGSATGELRRVAWRLREGTLEYLVWPALDAAPGTLPATDAVLENVDELQLRALGDDGIWRSAWPPSGRADHLPRAIEMQIVLAGGARVTRLFPLR